MASGLLTFTRSQEITLAEVEQNQAKWANAIKSISATYAEKGDCVQAAAAAAGELYGYGHSNVLLKPTKATAHPFRPTPEEAMSYFVGADAMNALDFKGEDGGFAINGGKGWKSVVFKNHQVELNGNIAIAMGSYDFTCATTGDVATVEYTFGYKRNKDGKSRIFLHHSSIPYSTAPATNAITKSEVLSLTQTVESMGSEKEASMRLQTTIANMEEKLAAVEKANVELNAEKQILEQQLERMEQEKTHMMDQLALAQPTFSEGPSILRDMRNIMTPPPSPRDKTLPQSPRKGRRSVAARRFSKVAFMEDLGFGITAVELSKSDAFKLIAEGGAEQEEDAADPGCFASFRMASADSESEQSEGENEEYDFDPQKLSQLVESGASQAELLRAAEEAMADQFEKSVREKQVELKEQMEEAVQRQREKKTAKKSKNCARARAKAERAVNSQINMEAAAQQRRKSVAKLSAAIGQPLALDGMPKRHRMSIAKAADVLISAKYDNGHTATETVEKMNIVAEIVEQARVNHRRSVAKAVHKLPAWESTWGQTSSADNRVNALVALAYEQYHGCMSTR